MRTPNVTEYRGAGMPDWVKPGGYVAVVAGYGTSQTVTHKIVERVTATQVVIGDTKYNLKRNLKRVGPVNEWSSEPFLADPYSEEVKYAVLVRNVARAKYNVTTATDNFRKAPTFENANAIADAVTAWKKAYVDAGGE